MTVSALRLWVEQKIAEGIIDKSLLADDSQTKKKHISEGTPNFIILPKRYQAWGKGSVKC